MQRFESWFLSRAIPLPLGKDTWWRWLDTAAARPRQVWIRCRQSVRALICRGCLCSQRGTDASRQQFSPPCSSPHVKRGRARLMAANCTGTTGRAAWKEKSLVRTLQPPHSLSSEYIYIHTCINTYELKETRWFKRNTTRKSSVLLYNTTQHFLPIDPKQFNKKDKY